MNSTGYIPEISVSQPFLGPTSSSFTFTADVFAGPFCSVKGCNLPLTSKNKMCKTCREKHRVYAVTKRLRRKAEKAAAAGEVLEDDPSISIPVPNVGTTAEDNSTSAPLALSSPPNVDRNDASSSAITQSAASTSTIPDYSRPETWGVSNYNIDPRLLPPYSSELLGALKFKTTPSASSTTTAPAVPTSPKPRILKAARYCSVKGCKKVMPDDSFFKMCDPCRVRYRGYGTTKRAKWKLDKDLSEAQLEAASSTGSVPPSDTAKSGPEEPDDIMREAPKSPVARMCSVSHCRELLAAGSSFKRCDQHRIQNRHHSRLKREREKEVKAQAMAAWAKTSAPDPDDDVETLSANTHLDSSGSNNEPSATIEKKTGIGTRISKRLNDTCSVRMCHNLLDPNVPWKMCEPCRELSRERDRMIKIRKAFREARKSSETATFSDVGSAPRLHELDGTSFVVPIYDNATVDDNHTNSDLPATLPNDATTASSPSQTAPATILGQASTADAPPAQQQPLPAPASNDPLAEQPRSKDIPKKKAKRKKRSKETSAEDKNWTINVPVPSISAGENTVPPQVVTTPVRSNTAQPSQPPQDSTPPYHTVPSSLYPQPSGDPRHDPPPPPQYCYSYHAYPTATYYQNGYGMISGASGSYHTSPPSLQPPHPQYVSSYSYPYQYPYSHPYPYPYPHPHPTGQIASTHLPRPYYQLQWDTVMTPQTTSTHTQIEAQILTPGPRSHANQTASARKRKRRDVAVEVGSVSAQIEEMPSSPKNSAVEIARDPSPKRQVFSCTNTTCQRAVSSSNSVCDKCKEKLNRRRLKARKRFRLGPKGLKLGQSATTKTG